VKFLVFVLTLSVLIACTRQAQPDRDPAIPPLSAVAPLIAPGMTMEEVTRKMSGHKPFMTINYPNSKIWEFNERIPQRSDNSIQSYRLMVHFDPQEHVSKSTLSECLLPDQEIRTSPIPSTLCYRKHSYPFDESITYNAIKRLLIISNFQIDHSDASSKIISATGLQPKSENDGGIIGSDEIMYIKLSINFYSPENNITEVVMSANFNIIEKRMALVHGGFAGVVIPIPLPFRKTEEWTDAGLATPKFYLDFYDSLSKLISSENLAHPSPDITSQSRVFIGN
jgi:hypothetical protein